MSEARRMAVELMREARTLHTAGSYDAAGVSAAAALMCCVGEPGLRALEGAADRLLADCARRVAVAEEARQSATVYRIGGMLATGQRLVLVQSAASRDGLAVGRWAFEAERDVVPVEFGSWRGAELAIERLRQIGTSVGCILAVGQSRREWDMLDAADARAAWYYAQIGVSAQ